MIRIVWYSIYYDHRDRYTTLYRNRNYGKRTNLSFSFSFFFGFWFSTAKCDSIQSMWTLDWRLYLDCIFFNKINLIDSKWSLGVYEVCTKTYKLLWINRLKKRSCNFSGQNCEYFCRFYEIDSRRSNEEWITLAKAKQWQYFDTNGCLCDANLAYDSFGLSIFTHIFPFDPLN